MGYGMLNLGSLILGIFAWLCPIICPVMTYKKRVAFFMASFASCAASLYLQILYSNYLVEKEDWSALLDTSSAVRLISGILIIGTAAINIIVMTICYKNKGSE